jgi:hypothetical protein
MTVNPLRKPSSTTDQAPAEPPNSGESPDRTSLILSPEQLEQFRRVDPALPLLIVQADKRARSDDFWYALIGMLSGLILNLSLIAVFAYLVMHGQARYALFLLGAQVLSAASTFVKARLHK